MTENKILTGREVTEIYRSYYSQTMQLCLLVLLVKASWRQDKVLRGVKKVRRWGVERKVGVYSSWKEI